MLGNSIALQLATAHREPTESGSRLFEVFCTTESHFMAMGLRIAASIMESHSRHLWVTPNAGPGDTFSCALPWESFVKIWRFAADNVGDSLVQSLALPRPRSCREYSVSRGKVLYW
jgi:hypothetical protein